ncbi:hypothetical protein ACOME3_007149 [Neoechinorhynchus agilis]
MHGTGSAKVRSYRFDDEKNSEISRQLSKYDKFSRTRNNCSYTKRVAQLEGWCSRPWCDQPCYIAQKLGRLSSKVYSQGQEKKCGHQGADWHLPLFRVDRSKKFALAR